MYNGTSIVIITQYPQCCQMVVDLLSHVNTWWEPKSLTKVRYLCLEIPLISTTAFTQKKNKTKQQNYQAKAYYYFSMDTAFLIDTRL